MDEQKSHKRNLKSSQGRNNSGSILKESGIKIGEQQAVLKGMRLILIRQLSRRLGGLPQEVIDQLNGLSPEALIALSEAVFDFDTLAALYEWLMQ
ncbi:MAG: DUF4351 domain-containing protein [Leptolyngbyaceae cyanobacterium]